MAPPAVLGGAPTMANTRSLIEQLYTYSLDQDEEWEHIAHEVVAVLKGMRQRWRELEATRRALQPPPKRRGRGKRAKVD